MKRYNVYRTPWQWLLLFGSSSPRVIFFRDCPAWSLWNNYIGYFKSWYLFSLFLPVPFDDLCYVRNLVCKGSTKQVLKYSSAHQGIRWPRCLLFLGIKDCFLSHFYSTISPRSSGQLIQVIFISTPWGKTFSGDSELLWLSGDLNPGLPHCILIITPCWLSLKNKWRKGTFCEEGLYKQWIEYGFVNELSFLIHYPVFLIRI